jgi:hypothetical protein
VARSSNLVVLATVLLAVSSALMARRTPRRIVPGDRRRLNKPIVEALENQC